MVKPISNDLRKRVVAAVSKKRAADRLLCELCLMIRAAGTLVPTYLNPIEQAFSKIKHWMRLAQRRTVEDVCRQIRNSRH